MVCTRDNTDDVELLVVSQEDAPVYELLRRLFTARSNARITSAGLATAIPSVRLSACLSVCPSVRHTPVLCQNNGRYSAVQFALLDSKCA